MTNVRWFMLPDLGEGLTEAEIVKWLVVPGETVRLNQPVVEVETAKAAVEIPAMWAGRVAAVEHAEGEVVAVGTPIIAIDTDPATADQPAAPGGAEAPGSGGGGNGRVPVLVGYGPRAAGAPTRRPRAAGPAGARPAGAVAGPALAKPPVRKLARDLGVDLRALAGTGPGGSVTRADVLAAGARAEQATARPAAASPAGAAAARAAGGPPAGSADVGDGARIPVRGVRKAMAEHMVASAFTAPHVTEFLTVDATRAVRAVDRLREHPAWQGVRPSVLLLVARAALAAARRYPMINATWAGDEIILRDHVNLGIAVATDRGLVVPNVKHADRLANRELAEALRETVETARGGRSTPAELAGGTFTITNVGVFGVDAGTPILPRGESAILALGAVRDAPWAHRGKVKVRKVITLSLSFDHRVVDGELGARFLTDVGAFLNDPETSMLAYG